MPAMNAAVTVNQTVGNIPGDWVDEVIVVDDHSTDRTVDVARELPLRLVWHPTTRSTEPTRRLVTSRPCNAM
jgi:glycosyltransferase involved in cell wall biosynthesis